MKAKELMIGDWVLHEGEPYQIRQLGIFGENRDGDDYPAVCVGKPNGVGLILDRNEIKPIPITSEILEKNGWKVKKGFVQHGNFGDGPLMLWHTEENKILRNFTHELEISDLSSDKGCRVIIECNYVHELQHALCLCGIEKEIELL